MPRLTCVISKVIYQNIENGYAVLQADVKDSFLKETLVGCFFEVRVGLEIIAEGEWKFDKRYGRQFAVHTWNEKLPITTEGIKNYLSSGKIKGIGPAIAELIVSHFGLNTFNVIENNIERLQELPGIGTTRIVKIKESWNKMHGVNEVIVFLQSYGVSPTFATKIYKVYGRESIEKVNANPYCLVDDIFGMGFKSADAIAQKMGYALNDKRRCQAGIFYTLNVLSNEGHVFAEKDQLIEKAVELLTAEEQNIKETLNKMIETKELIYENESVFLPILYHAEKGVAEKIKTLMSTPLIITTCRNLDLEHIAKTTNINYDEVQMMAIRQAVLSKIMVLTGGPGTGKTTTTLGIIAALDALGISIQLAAPTGRAAKRMSEATGMEAKTIHRLLEFNPSMGFKRNENNPIEGGALIVDESSMIDILLMNELLKAVPSYMRLILVGDVDQLPSVGAGNVLRDIIDSERIPVVKLTRIFRQAQSSRIITNAHKINHGCFPDISNGLKSDFFFIKNEDPTTAAKTIVNIVRDRIPNAYHISTNNIQVLTPMRKGVVGANNLNEEIQKAINPKGDCMCHGLYKYRKRDRVMQIRNNYEKEVYNGDIGIIENVDIEEQTLSVRFNQRVVDYDSVDLDELTLAYATTIHKSQGSEYPVVVMPVLTAHFMMLQRNLIYTGITRAKRICIVVGSTKAMAMAIQNQVVLKRNTRLKEKLTQALPYQGKTEKTKSHQKVVS